MNELDLAAAFGAPPQDHSPELRQLARQDNVPLLYRTTHERLAVELALHMEEPEAIFARYNYTPEQAAELLDSPAFTVLLNRVAIDIRENGLSFKAKIKAVAEDLIPHMHDMATDPLCSSAVRADIGKWAAKMAGFEPAPAKTGAEQGTNAGFTLSITFAGQPPQQIVSGREPLTITQEN